MLTGLPSALGRHPARHSRALGSWETQAVAFKLMRGWILFMSRLDWAQIQHQCIYLESSCYVFNACWLWYQGI